MTRKHLKLALVSAILILFSLISLVLYIFRMEIRILGFRFICISGLLFFVSIACLTKILFDFLERRKGKFPKFLSRLIKVISVFVCVLSLTIGLLFFLSNIHSGKTVTRNISPDKRHEVVIFKQEDGWSVRMYKRFSPFIIQQNIELLDYSAVDYLDSDIEFNWYDDGCEYSYLQYETSDSQPVRHSKFIYYNGTAEQVD